MVHSKQVMRCLQVTVVDASNILANFESSDLLLDRHLASTEADSRSIVNLMMDQIEFADVLVLNKVDMVAQAEVRKIILLLRRLNPAADILQAVHCRLPIGQILNTKRSADRHDCRQARLTATIWSVVPGWMVRRLLQHQCICAVREICHLCPFGTLQYCILVALTAQNADLASLGILCNLASS